VTGNTAVGIGSYNGYDYGDAVGGIVCRGTTTITNTTVADNLAMASARPQLASLPPT
jgi:hypothetical protein